MRSDIELQQDVIAELRYEPSLDEREIGVNVSNGLITMTGRVKSYLEKLAAVRAAERVRGVRGIANEVTVVPPTPFEHTDTEIAEAAIRALTWRPSLPAEAIKARVERGWITLEGKVPWYYQRNVAEEAVRGLAGVRGVINSIAVESGVKPAQVSEKIKAAMTRSAALHAQQIKVDVHDRQVVLKGTVHSWGERAEAEQAAWAAPGVTTVQNELVVGG